MTTERMAATLVAVPAVRPVGGPVPRVGSMLISEHLQERVRRDGATPLITHYDVPAGSRTELSATTFANWVAKASNLCVEELELEPGDEVAMPLLRLHPEHWMSLVWVAAAWAVGASVRPAADTGTVVVVGPEALAEPAPWPGTVLACSLHPLGLGLREALPVGWLDWSSEVRSQPDHFVGLPPGGDLGAWDDGEQVLDQTVLATVPGSPARVLVRPTSPWETVRDALVAPLLGGGSAVVVTGGGPEDLARIAADERTA